MPFHGLSPHHQPEPKQLLIASQIFIALSAMLPLYRLPIDLALWAEAPIKKRPTFLFPTLIIFRNIV